MLLVGLKPWSFTVGFFNQSHPVPAVAVHLLCFTTSSVALFQLCVSLESQIFRCLWLYEDQRCFKDETKQTPVCVLLCVKSCNDMDFKTFFCATS